MKVKQVLQKCQKGVAGKLNRCCRKVKQVSQEDQRGVTWEYFLLKNVEREMDF